MRPSGESFKGHQIMRAADPAVVLSPDQAPASSDKYGNKCQTRALSSDATLPYSISPDCRPHNAVPSVLLSALPAPMCFYVAFYLPFSPIFTNFALSFYTGSALASATRWHVGAVFFYSVASGSMSTSVIPSGMLRHAPVLGSLRWARIYRRVMLG